MDHEIIFTSSQKEPSTKVPGSLFLTVFKIYLINADIYYFYQKNGEIIYSSNKYSSSIHPILAEQIKSPRYSEINSIFLTK